MKNARISLRAFRILFAVLCVFGIACSPPLARTAKKSRPALYVIHQAEASEEEVYRDEAVAGEPSSDRRRTIVKTAMSLVGTPYRRGGQDKRGFDCSGLTLYVYKKNKLKLPRTANAQFVKGKKVKGSSLRQGDLVFFNVSGKSISHVGIYIGKGKFVHAPSSGKHVEVEELSSIYWKPRYRGGAAYM